MEHPSPSLMPLRQELHQVLPRGGWPLHVPINTESNLGAGQRKLACSCGMTKLSTLKPVVSDVQLNFAQESGLDQLLLIGGKCLLCAH